MTEPALDPEPRVQARIEAALAGEAPAAGTSVTATSAATGARVYPNVRWVDRPRDGAPLRDGEIDHLVVLPEIGLLAIETKGGIVSLDGHGRWYAGNRHLEESPFEQAMIGAHVIARKIAAHPGWHGAPPPRATHAVAFPDSERARLERDRLDLGPDAPLELVIDRADLATPETTRSALDRVVATWAGRSPGGGRGRGLTERELDIVHEVIEPDVRLEPLLRSELEAGEHELLAPTHAQLAVLKTLGHLRRAAIVGGAGSGKSLLAAEKARSLASIGFDVLLVCFNQPLARSFADRPDLRALREAGRLTISTFHELCRSVAAEAGTLPAQPPHPGQDWFELVLPTALDAAMPSLPRRWQALVIDEGQDLEADWLLRLTYLLSDPDEDDLYVFHDPAQALYRDDAVDVLALPEFALPENCRNSRPIHDFAYRWYTGGLEAEALREDGREPRIVAAEPGDATVEAMGAILDELVKREGVEPIRIGVLTGVSLRDSGLWRRRRFHGGLVLWNGSYDDAGESLGLSADAVPAQPTRTIRLESIHRSKGLEWDVVVLAELRPDDPRLAMLLYIGASRAKHHLVVVAPPPLVAQLREPRR